jgi:hypothetical protein
MTMKKALEAIALGAYGRAKLIPDGMHLYGPTDWEIARGALGKPNDRCRRFPRYSGKTPPGDCIRSKPGRNLDGDEVPASSWSCSTCLAKWFARNGAKRIPTKRKARKP